MQHRRAPGLGGRRTLSRKVEKTRMHAKLYGARVDPDLPARIQRNRFVRRWRDLSSPINMWKELSWKS
jgi:hypothetical protein